MSLSHHALEVLTNASEQLVATADRFEEGADDAFLASLLNILDQLRSCSEECQDNEAYCGILQAVCEALYMQAIRLSTEGRHSEVDALLLPLGITIKLSPAFWHCKAQSAHAPSPVKEPTVESPAVSHSCPVVVLDKVLDDSLIQQLQSAFAPGAPYWEVHSYHDPLTPFFSYQHPLDQKPKTIVEEAAQKLLRTLRGVSDTAAMVEGVKWVEWWAHVRDASQPHQLHFDANEGLFRKGVQSYKLQHPAVSTVLFLSNTGGPTLVLDHTADGLEMNRGWAVLPTSNRVVAFHGNRLHGVLPAAAETPPPPSPPSVPLTAATEAAQALAAPAPHASSETAASTPAPALSEVHAAPIPHRTPGAAQANPTGMAEPPTSSVAQPRITLVMVFWASELPTPISSSNSSRNSSSCNLLPCMVWPYVKAGSEGLGRENVDPADGGGGLLAEGGEPAGDSLGPVAEGGALVLVESRRPAGDGAGLVAEIEGLVAAGQDSGINSRNTGCRNIKAPSRDSDLVGERPNRRELLPCTEGSGGVKAGCEWDIEAAGGVKAGCEWDIEAAGGVKEWVQTGKRGGSKQGVGISDIGGSEEVFAAIKKGRGAGETETREGTCREDGRSKGSVVAGMNYTDPLTRDTHSKRMEAEGGLQAMMYDFSCAAQSAEGGAPEVWSPGTVCPAFVEVCDGHGGVKGGTGSVEAAAGQVCCSTSFNSSHEEGGCQNDANWPPVSCLPPLRFFLRSLEDIRKAYVP